MKRLGIFAVTGIMTLALSGCGGDTAPPMPDASTDDAQMQMMTTPADTTTQPAADVTPAAPGTASEAVTAPAPTEGQMMGATAEE